AGLGRLMVGRDVLLRVGETPGTPGAPVLCVRNLSMIARDGTRRLEGVSLEVHAGEIVGIAGVEGNGQTELIEALAGLVDPSRLTGGIEFEGRNITQLNARMRKEKGIAHVPEDRHRRVLLIHSVLSVDSFVGVY